MIYSWNITMQKTLILTCALCLLLPLSPGARQDGKSPSLEKLHQAIAKLVVRHYPKATSHVFEHEIGFDYATRVYVTRLVSKVPAGVEAPRAPVRGPMEDGVWCRIWYRAGDLKTQPQYQRSEGELRRQFFKEHIYYPNDSRNKCHLLVTLRLPLKTTKAHVHFVSELRQLLSQSGKHLSTKGQ